MAIRQQSPTLLVLDDGAAGMRLMGVVFALMGSVALYAGIIVGGHNAWVAVVVGAVFTILGIAALLGPWAHHIVFDRSAGRVRIDARGPIGSHSTTYALADIADVELEESSDTKGGTTYRTTFVMRDGSRRPWTSYYVGLGARGYVAEVGEITAMRRFLGTADKTTLPDGSPAIAAPPPAATPPPAVQTARRGASGCGIVFLSVFVAVGGRLAWTQHQRLATYRPVPARVQEVSVATVEDHEGGSPTYRPEVTYMYAVGGAWYSSNHVTPISESRGGDWATKITREYHVGQLVTAYYNPSHPSDAYLLHQESFLPYIFVVAPLVMIGFLLIAMRSTGATAPTARDTAAA